MALIKCNECGKEMSDKATTCVCCGNPIKKQIISQKKWQDLTSQDKKMLKKDLEEKNVKLEIIRPLIVIVLILTIPVIIWMFILDSLLSPFVCLGIVIIYAIMFSSYQKELKRTYENFFNTTNNNNLKETTTIISNNSKQKNNVKKNKNNKLIILLIVCIIICFIVFVIPRVIETYINTNKCESGYTYDKTKNLCWKRISLTLKDENGNCPDGYYPSYSSNLHCEEYDTYIP